MEKYIEDIESMQNWTMSDVNNLLTNIIYESDTEKRKKIIEVLEEAVKKEQRLSGVIATRLGDLYSFEYYGLYNLEKAIYYYGEAVKLDDRGGIPGLKKIVNIPNITVELLGITCNTLTEIDYCKYSLNRNYTSKLKKEIYEKIFKVEMEKNKKIFENPEDAIKKATEQTNNILESTKKNYTKTIDNNNTNNETFSNEKKQHYYQDQCFFNNINFSTVEPMENSCGIQ